MKIIEVPTYPENYVTKYLLENNKGQIKNEDDAKQYYDLFDGNMKDLIIFLEQKNSLQGLNTILS